MTRGKFIFDGTKFVPAPKEKPRVKSLVGDEMLDGVEHPATGEKIYSRSQFKKITKAHGLEECYGEPDKYWEKPDDSEQREKDLENDILKSLADLEYGEGLSEEEIEICKQKEQIREWNYNN